VSAPAGLLAACSIDSVSEPPTSKVESGIALDGHLSGISDADFNAARDNFNLVETIARRIVTTAAAAPGAAPAMSR